MPSINIRTLRQRVLQSGSWTLAGYGVNQALRLGGNLILTRLLFPEAFGMMVIIQAVIYGVHMLTDVGVGPSIVQKDRGNDLIFLNTAWTIQIVRGLLVWLALCALAFPLAGIYDEPLLANMIPVVGLSAIINGFNSTNLYTAERNMELVRVMQIEIGTYALGLLCTIFIAWLQQSVWSLVWGQLISVSLKMTASHVFLHGIKNKLAWERDALDHLIGFGRWILFSSALTFLSMEGARLLIGSMLDMRQLALFTLASTLSLMFWQAMQQMAGRVFFPAYSEIHRSNPENLKKVLFKVRLTLIFPSWLLAVTFVFLGSHIIEILYDDRYRESGVMLEQLAAGSLVACVWGSYSGVLLALGKVSTMAALTAIQIACQFVMMFIGYSHAGASGLIIGVAAANWMVYPFYAYALSRNGLFQPNIDLAILAVSVLIVLLAWPNFIPV